MSELFKPDGMIDESQLKNLTQEDLINLIATQRASQNKPNPYAVYQQAMQMQQQKMPGQATAPQIRRGQAVNILSPLEELMKLQQMQASRQRPQSLI